MSEDEFTERFVAHMVKCAGKSLEDGTDVEQYAREMAPTYFEDEHYRKDGPEACVDADMSYWGED